jgi:hypothetical protein
MEALIKQAFIHVDGIGQHVQQGYYDLVGPNDEIILPQVWEHVIEPGWNISMLMWPLGNGPRQKAYPPAGMRPPGRRPGGSMPPPPPPLQCHSLGCNAIALPGRGFCRDHIGNNLNSPHPGMRPHMIPSGLRHGRPGHPPPPPDWARPPAAPPGVHVINIEKPKRKSKTHNSNMFSWLAGGKPSNFSAKKGDKHPTQARPPSPPPDVVAAAEAIAVEAPREAEQAIVSRRTARRPTIGGSLVPRVPLPRPAADLSLSLHAGKRSKKAMPKADESSSSESMTSETRSSVKSGSSYDDSDSETEEARQEVAKRGLIITCKVIDRPVRRPTVNVNSRENKTSPVELLKLDSACIYREGQGMMNLTSLELIKCSNAQMSEEEKPARLGANWITWL